MSPLNLLRLAPPGAENCNRSSKKCQPAHCESCIHFRGCMGRRRVVIVVMAV